jgi:hypothetical protein
MVPCAGSLAAFCIDIPASTRFLLNAVANDRKNRSPQFRVIPHRSRYPSAIREIPLDNGEFPRPLTLVILRIRTEVDLLLDYLALLKHL